MPQQSVQLEVFAVKSQGDILEKIHVEHNTKPLVKYTLTTSAKKLF